jgi:hypothetical protein
MIQNSTPPLNELPDYKLLQYFKGTGNGYIGYAFQNVNTNEIIVVHAGSAPLPPTNLNTDTLVDMYEDRIRTNIGGLGAGTLPSQFYSADYFLDHVMAHNQGVEISQVGQSLGAGLTQGLGMLEKYKDIPAYAYNPPGMLRFESELGNNGFKLSDDYSNITNLISQNEPLSKLMTIF